MTIIMGPQLWRAIVCAFVICEVAQLISGAEFGYTVLEQQSWSSHHHECAGKYQSPIAIYSSEATPLEMPSIKMVGYRNLLPGPLSILNDGHAMSLSIPKDTLKKGQRMPYIFGGLLQDEYELESLHFHWGDKSTHGSEHVVNDIHYPMEMHIIHRNIKYKTLTEALGHEDGLCVLGFFSQVSDSENPALVKIVRDINLIEQVNKSVALNTSFSLQSLLGDVDLDRFYTYRGSLTTPPCSESVRWVVFPDTIRVTESQLNKFRRLTSGAHGSSLVDNFRNLQPLGDRRVFVRSPMKTPRINKIHFENSDWLN